MGRGSSGAASSGRGTRPASGGGGAVPGISDALRSRIDAATTGGENVSVSALGLQSAFSPSLRGKTRDKDVAVGLGDIKLSRDSLNKTRLLALEKQLAGGLKKQRAFNINVVRDPRNPGKYIVSRDGNHRIAYLQLVGYRGKVNVTLTESTGK